MFFSKRKKGGGGDELKIFYAADFHGSTTCFKKFIGGAEFYNADVLIYGGDFTGKAVMPIARQKDGTCLAHQHGQDLRLENEDEVADFIRRTVNMGFYPVTLSEDEFREVSSSEDKQYDLFKRLACERIEEWAEYAEKKLKGTGIRLIGIPGNDDFWEIDEILEASGIFEYHHREVTEIGEGYQIVHVGGSNWTPWNTEREFTEEDYEKWFSELAQNVEDMSRCIYNIHVPPHGTALDKCPKLDDNLKVVMDMGNPVQMHAGSTALREAIEQHQPLLSLHGHIHESRGNVKLGRTVCVNPGSVYPEGYLQGALIHLKGGAVKSVQLTQG